ncbi:hypothetical protein F8568_016060 [Actinomadura sp. LD22]|uniref:Uncharacterized protein n=1 Tax=Actinomadura physcomitrii TaxID=2650748 RepID=A0A6I4MI17_9ACTN|nr:hypothetical protein [Actinomadura physcomitrii]MWA01856.1 hypothetical protein [Actinomadura physcomitrii]
MSDPGARTAAPAAVRADRRLVLIVVLALLAAAVAAVTPPRVASAN